MISALDANTNKQTVQMYACIRDTKQAVIDLKRVLPEDAEADSPLLPAFLAGYLLFSR